MRPWVQITLFFILPIVLYCQCLADGSEVMRELPDAEKALYNEDTVPVSAIDVPVLISKGTNKVEYFWSSEDNGWVNAGRHQLNLQYLYDNRAEIRKYRQLK